ncbi:benzoylformate decarboxylase [Streptomyces sp. NPDC002644]
MSAWPHRPLPAPHPQARPGTVREAVIEILRRNDARVIFGNPGTTELAFLDDLPGDIRYVLGLNESSITAIADGYAQARGKPVLVNLHTAAGLGNAMGALVNAHAARSPLVVLTGQQERALLGAGAILTNPAPALLPLGAVKHAEEPASAEDVPAALARAFHLAALPPAGPVCVSVPMDDWDRPLPAGASLTAIATRVRGQATAPEQTVADLADLMAHADHPAMVVGPGADSPRAFWAVAELAERLAAPVWVTPYAHRIGFPTDRPAFQGQLPLSVEETSSVLAPHDLVLVVGGPVFRYMTARSWPALTSSTRVIALTDDPVEASRNIAGETVVGDVGHTLRALCRQLSDHRPTPRPSKAGTPQQNHTPGYAEVFTALREILPAQGVVVSEPPQGFEDLYRILPRTQPGSFYFAAACGLGFAAGAAVGIALADPARPVVAVLGDGSLQYNLQALWTAAQERIPVCFVVVNNSGYGILQDLAQGHGFKSLQGMELPGIDIPALARGYGVPATRVTTEHSRLVTALRTPVPAGPRLIEVVLPSPRR